MTLTAAFAKTVTAIALVISLPLAAQALPAAEGPVILTVTGTIATANDGDAARFDLDMLKALPTTEIRTTTIWTDGVQNFTGVSLADLLQAVGAVGPSVSATAINDYAVEIPQEDWLEHGAMVAYLNKGEPMSVRDKGPLWIIYPYDSDKAYQSEVIYSRSIWQLDRIAVGE